MSVYSRIVVPEICMKQGKNSFQTKFKTDIEPANFSVVFFNIFKHYKIKLNEQAEHVQEE